MAPARMFTIDVQVSQASQELDMAMRHAIYELKDVGAVNRVYEDSVSTYDRLLALYLTLGIEGAYSQL